VREGARISFLPTPSGYPPSSMVAIETRKRLVVIHEKDGLPVNLGRGAPSLKGLTAMLPRCARARAPVNSIRKCGETPVELEVPVTGSL
jgi:hypothetical protein